jgi:hypothetical protein
MKIVQGLVDWREEDDSCGQQGKVVQIVRNGGAGQEEKGSAGVIQWPERTRAATDR